MKTRKYRWASPDPNSWSSFYSFDSFAAARDAAILHARNKHKRKHKYHIPPDARQTRLIWRLMREAGWKVQYRYFPVGNT
jgi:hypothetical protein